MGVSGSGPARGRMGWIACLVSLTAELVRTLCGNRESSRRQTPPHSRPEAILALHRGHACTFSQGDGAWFWRQPHSRLPQRARANHGVDEAKQAIPPSRPRGGQSQNRAPSPCREVYERNLTPPQHQAEAKQCTAQPPTQAPAAVPRETPQRQQATQPTRPQGVCPSSPSTPPPASTPHATSW